MGIIFSSQWRKEEKLAHFRRKLDLGRRKWLLRRWRKPVTITVECHTAYLLWAFSVICCPRWLDSFVEHNYLGRSAGSIFVYYYLWVLFFVGFIFHGSLHPTKIKSVENFTTKICAHENFHVYDTRHFFILASSLEEKHLQRRDLYPRPHTRNRTDDLLSSSQRIQIDFCIAWIVRPWPD